MSTFMPGSKIKTLLQRFIYRLCGGLLISILIFSILNVKMLYDANYSYNTLLTRFLSWNLRELPEYPDTRIIYVRDMDNGKLEVGIYPYLDCDLLRKIKTLGYPYNISKVYYIGTDDLSDMEKYWDDPLGLSTYSLAAGWSDPQQPPVDWDFFYYPPDNAELYN